MKDFLGQNKPANTQAAHIIAKNDPKFSISRNIANQVGIDMNHPANGVWLPNNKAMADKFGTFIHNNGLSETHSPEFANTLNNKILNSVKSYMGNDGLIKPEYKETAKLKVIEVLNQARQTCLNGGW